MAFKDKYTTEELQSKNASTLSMMSPDGVEPVVEDKIIISNDAYAIGEMLECLINKMVK